MTVDMHAVRPWGGEPIADPVRGAPDSDGDWSYPARWHLDAPEVLEETEEEVVGTLFNGPLHLDTAQTLLDAASPEDGKRLREALSASDSEIGICWSVEALRAIIDVLSRIPDPIKLGGAIPRLDDDDVERLSERLPLTEFYTPAPVTMAEKREALRFWIHNARIVGHFFAKALENDCYVTY